MSNVGLDSDQIRHCSKNKAFSIRVSEWLASQKQPNMSSVAANHAFQRSNSNGYRAKQT